MSQRRLLGAGLALLALASAALLITLVRGVGAVGDEVAALESAPARVSLARDVDLPAFGPADRIALSFLSAEDDIEFGGRSV